MEFRVLGPLQVIRDGDGVALTSAKQRAVLTTLILSANQVVSTDRLTEAVWRGSPPSTATHALQVYISQLRRSLEPSRDANTAPRMLLTQAPGYLLRVGVGDLDSDRFESLAAEGRAHLASGSPDIAAGLLREALAQWRGHAFADLTGDDVAEREATRLEELRQAAAEDQIDADLARGRHAEVVAELRSMVAAHPFRERAWAQLMLALYRCGRQQQALEAYRTLWRQLDEELGVAPAVAVRDLHARMLRQAPELDWPVVTGTPPARTPVPLRLGPSVSARQHDEPPETRYVHTDINLAYQAIGHGDIDLVLLPGYFSHLEVRWEEPRLASLYRRLASRSRLVMIDRRGCGLSDRSSQIPSPEQQMTDVLAVMDAVGSTRAVFFGVSDGGVLALLLAATHPDRVAGVITYAAYPAFVPPPATDPGPGAEDEGERQRAGGRGSRGEGERQRAGGRGAYGHSPEFMNLLAETAGQRYVIDLPLLDHIVAVMAPARVNDDGFIRWLGRYTRLSAGPGATAAAFEAMRQIDIRHALDHVRAPTLVLHRRGDRSVPLANARYLAEHIPDVRLVELAGDDHIIWAGDVDAIAGHVEHFVAEAVRKRSSADPGV
ncbi:MAG TPA: alpha/beta fold hydrolase [Euzebyales bacterium]|nr:alpha/beta fold hydrolase [Euzebyales bacterium]